ncbi:hypothetical protein SteCoe_28467 [Stentor coeruleus]|uniref:MORN repeat protein n=1 Tax=Stentor coeruleus TaxID=5963 RepID=A0A1R2B8P5_9CILI|nr:hypothetical protein SteCoe_28467 [Stentor coeruleus]
MGIDCSCMRMEFLEEKTIMIGDANHLQYKDNSHLLTSTALAEKYDISVGSVEIFSKNNTVALTSLSRRFLTIKMTKDPTNFFETCKNQFDYFVPAEIKYIETILCPIITNVPDTVYKLSKNEIYQGNFDYLMRKTGPGYQLLNNEKYSGHFSKGNCEGFGRVIKPDGSILEGDFKKGNLEGEGASLERGIRYKGNFIHGIKAGEGREEWPDKTVYIGQFFNNLKHGTGKFVWSNGNKFKGQFQNGDISGEGVFKWKNGKKYTGMWKNNKMHGQGKFEWPNGKVYIGEYKFDIKDGIGKLIWPDGREYEGEWKDGLQHGEGVYKWFNKIKNIQESRKGLWENGNRVSWLN